MKGYILQKLRQREGLEPNDTSMDDKFKGMRPYDVLDEVLHWEGFFGYTGQIISWIKDSGYEVKEKVEDFGCIRGVKND